MYASSKRNSNYLFLDWVHHFRYTSAVTCPIGSIYHNLALRERRQQLQHHLLLLRPQARAIRCFSVATNLQSKFTFTPGAELTEDATVLPAIINLSGSVTATASKSGSTPASASKTSITVGDSGDAGGDSNASDAGSSEFPSTSNTEFTEVNSKLHPKTAELLTNRCAYGSASLRSYHGELDILENQSAFNDAGIRWNEMFRLGVNPAGQTNVVEYKNIRKEIEEMGQEILFEVFCHKFTDAYVGQAFCKEKNRYYDYRTSASLIELF